MIRKAKKRYAVIALALAATLLASTAAVAAVTLNPDGTGFVGKGDVQTALGLNNKALQDNANSIQFRALTTTETSWTCSRTGPQGQEQTQERARTVEAQQVVSSAARERNQITGFNLTGFTGSPTVISSDGPPLGSCPTGWTASEPQSEVAGSTLQVSLNGSDWVNL